jgi:hypothetical protein
MVRVSRPMACDPPVTVRTTRVEDPSGKLVGEAEIRQATPAAAGATAARRAHTDRSRTAAERRIRPPRA